ncbi:MAG: tetraacyldisaccharide 4'-kinase [Rickettsia endosymbiont of Argas persicus]
MMKLLYPKFWQKRNIIAYLLLPLSIIFQLLGWLRHILANPITLPAKVICVGNCSVGGTGKTQIVIHLAKLLKSRGINFVIVTKAYGSKLKNATIVNTVHTASEVGDEAVILANYGTVIATKNIKQIISLIHQIKPSIIITDDFLQNPHFHKDITIITVDNQRLFGNGFLIPAGPLREYPSKALNSADLIFLVDNNSNIAPSCLASYTNKLIQAKIVVSNDVDKSMKYFAFSGIGNPERFFLTLKNHSLNIVGYKTFPDHYNYSRTDLKKLHLLTKKNNAVLITTSKDYVKIGDFKHNIICLDVELSINNSDLLYEKIFKKD